MSNRVTILIISSIVNISIILFLEIRAVKREGSRRRAVFPLILNLPAAAVFFHGNYKPPTMSREAGSDVPGSSCLVGAPRSRWAVRHPCSESIEVESQGEH